MKEALKRLASRLPPRWQHELKRHYFGHQVRSSSFRSGEAEYDLLPETVCAGDWVLDIGANVGHYTLRLSELVGDEGRVISFEPVPETFELLARHAAMAPCRNISLINAAASSSVGLCNMTVPRSAETALDNYYRARLSGDRHPSGFRVLCLPVDALALPHRIRLVKIDAEGHELAVLHGMKMLLQRDHPTLIIEDSTRELTGVLEQHGYRSEKLEGSCNRVFRPRRTVAGLA